MLESPETETTHLKSERKRETTAIATTKSSQTLEKRVERKMKNNSTMQGQQQTNRSQSINHSVNHEEEYSEYPDHQQIYHGGQQDIMSCFTCGRGFCSKGDYKVRETIRDPSQENRNLATPLETEEIPHDHNDNEGQDTTRPLIVLEDVSEVEDNLHRLSLQHNILPTTDHDNNCRDSDSSDDIVDIENRARFPKEAFDSRHTPNTLDYSDDGNDSCFSCGIKKRNKSGISNSRRRRQMMQATYQRNQQPDYDLDEEEETENLGRYHHPKEVLPTPSPLPLEETDRTDSLNQSLSF